MSRQKLEFPMRSVPRVRTLAEVDRIEIVCSDCGRNRVWSRSEILLRAPGDATLNDLGKKLVCKTCKAQGGLGYNVEIRCLAGDGFRRAG